MTAFLSIFYLFHPLILILVSAAKGGLKKLKIAAGREKLFIKQAPVDRRLHTEFTYCKRDPVSNFIVSNYGITSQTALFTTGNGDCLFNSFSILMVGDESKTSELRYRCCIEMVTNKSKIMTHRMIPKLEALSPDYDEDCLGCAQPGYWSSVWMIMALSNLLNLPVNSVYPGVGGCSSVQFKSLNCLFRPPFSDLESGVLNIMWTNTVAPEKNTFNKSSRTGSAWYPNHFVPLVNERVTSIELPINSENQVCKPQSPEPVTEIDQSFALSSMSRFKAEKKQAHKIGSLSTVLEEPDNDSYETAQCQGNGHNSFPGVNAVADASVVIDADEQHCLRSELNFNYMTEDDMTDDASERSFKPGPLENKYMGINELVQVLQGPYRILDDIPTGRKDGMYYVVDNRANIERRKNGKKSIFWDDCGAWKSAKTPKTLFLQKNDKIQTIVRHKGVYCSEKQVDKCRLFTPLEPQPNENQILEIHRLYQSLVASGPGENQFRRRLSWIEKVPKTLTAIATNVAIVEYIGKFPQRISHRTATKKTKSSVYIRTKDHVLTELKNRLKKDTAKTVVRHMNLQTKDDLSKHRDDKQLRNLRHSIRRAQSSTGTHNPADHVICVEEMTKSHPFVKTVKHIAGVNFPLVTLYTDQQINDIKRFCCREGGSVLCVDKTYNLGEFHVTPMVYKDFSVVRREGESYNPICIGPTFIHTSSITKAYSSFMHDIADNLTDCELKELVIGSDEEASLKSAIGRCFAGATHVLCTRHLKQNINRHLQDQVGYPLKERQDVICAIFGEKGLVASKDVDTYNARLSMIRKVIDEKDAHVSKGKFRPHFDTKLLSTLTKHVAQPAREAKILYNWTNNNSESANHILKAATQWRVNDMPTFIQKLYDIVAGEQEERIRAIRDRGSFVLEPTFRHHLVDIDQWEFISSDQKRRREARFLKDKGKDHPNIVVSTNGNRTIQIPASAGKKNNQRKRKRADRTFTPNAKKRIIITVRRNNGTTSQVGDIENTVNQMVSKNTNVI